MKVLHILRSVPTSMVNAIIEDGFAEDENVIAPLYEGEVDYDKLVRDLFASEQVISWW